MHRSTRLNCAVIVVGLLSVSLSFSQDRVTLVGHTSISGSVLDVWGYTDPATNIPYALVGTTNSIVIVDVSDPENPSVAASVGMPGFDLKTWGNYLYGVTGGGGTNQGKIADITDPANPTVVASFNSAHNIWISENGFLYAEYPGLKVYDLNPDPTAPQKVYDDGGSGGHDAAVIGTRLYDFAGSLTNIYEVSETESFSLTLLGVIDDPMIAYNHSGWPTEDDQYLFICDELSNHPNADISVWDISNLGDPMRVDEFNDPTATVHNLYVIGDYAYVSYYTAGFRVFDVSDPTSIEMVGEYDTNPNSGQGFSGAFGAYPFTESGLIYISEGTGLYIFEFDTMTTGVDEDEAAPQKFALAQNFPNPFNPSTTFEFSLPKDAHVTLTVANLLGQTVATVLNEQLTAGTYTRQWNPGQLASGIYLYTITAGDFVATKKLVYLR